MLASLLLVLCPSLCAAAAAAADADAASVHTLRSQFEAHSLDVQHAALHALTQSFLGRHGNAAAFAYANASVGAPLRALNNNTCNCTPLVNLTT